MAKYYDTLQHNVWLPYKFAVGSAYGRFYEGLQEEKIWGNKCPECGKVLVPPRSFCPDCHVDMDEWVEVSQEGEVRLWTLADYEFFGAPVDPPFIGALIRLDKTDCDLLHIIGGLDLSDLEAVKSKIKRGVRVKAVWNEEKQGHMLDLKYFEPV